MVKANIQAFAAGWAAQAIRDAVPTESDFAEAEISPAEWPEAMRELDRLANQMLAEALRLETLG